MSNQPNRLFIFKYLRPGTFTITFVGIILFGLALTGYAEQASVDRIFFIGMSIGTLIGFYPEYIFNKPKSYLHVALLLLFDGYTEASKEFQKKYEDETGEKL